MKLLETPSFPILPSQRASYFEENDLLVALEWDLKGECITHLHTCPYLAMPGTLVKSERIPLSLTGIATFVQTGNLCRGCLSPQRFETLMHLAEWYLSGMALEQEYEEASQTLRAEIERLRGDQ